MPQTIRAIRPEEQRDLVEGKPGPAAEHRPTALAAADAMLSAADPPWCSTWF